MDIKFKYKIPNNLLPLVNATVVDYGLDYIYGFMPKDLSEKLNHCSLYMICEFEFINDLQVWRNPVAIVGRNEIDAMETYVKNTYKENGSVLCEIVNKCDSIKVEPI